MQPPHLSPNTCPKIFESNNNKKRWSGARACVLSNTGVNNSGSPRNSWHSNSLAQTRENRHAHARSRFI